MPTGVMGEGAQGTNVVPNRRVMRGSVKAGLSNRPEITGLFGCTSNLHAPRVPWHELIRHCVSKQATFQEAEMSAVLLDPRSTRESGAVATRPCVSPQQGGRG